MTLHIRPACPRDDRNAILQLWHRNLPNATPERFHWMYASGPGRCWLALSRDGVPIGSAGLMVRDWFLAGHPCQVGQAIDLNVDMAHRSFGCALELERAVLKGAYESGLAFVYALPSESAVPIFKRLGFRELGIMSRKVAWFTTASLVQRLVKRRSIARPLAWFLDPFLPLRQPRSLLTDYSFETVRDFPSSLAGLESPGRFPFGCIGSRDPRYLRWRSLGTPNASISLLRRGSTEVVGYILSSRGSSECVTVLDFFFHDPEAGIALFQRFAKEMLEQGAATVQLSFLGASEIDAWLEANGFLARASKETVLVHVPRDDGWTDRQHWYFTRVDLDVD